MTQFITLFVINLVTNKAVAKHERLFKPQASEHYQLLQLLIFQHLVFLLFALTTAEKCHP